MIATRKLTSSSGNHELGKIAGVVTSLTSPTCQSEHKVTFIKLITCSMSASLSGNWMKASSGFDSEALLRQSEDVTTPHLPASFSICICLVGIECNNDIGFAQICQMIDNLWCWGTGPYSFLLTMLQDH